MALKWCIALQDQTQFEIAVADGSISTSPWAAFPEPGRTHIHLLPATPSKAVTVCDLHPHMHRIYSLPLQQAAISWEGFTDTLVGKIYRENQLHLHDPSLSSIHQVLQGSQLSLSVESPISS